MFTVMTASTQTGAYGAFDSDTHLDDLDALGGDDTTRDGDDTASAAGSDPAATDTAGNDSGAGAGSRKASSAANRNQVRRAITKAVELTSEPDTRLELLGAILGVGHDDLVKLTLAVVEAPRNADRAVQDILTVADADPMEAGVNGLELTENKAAFKAAWDLLERVGAVTGGAPSARAKAGLAFAKAAQALSTDNRKALEAAVALLK